jgi:hypothetical protein
MHEYSSDAPLDAGKPAPKLAAERRQRFLKELDSKVEAFKALCSTSICAEDFPNSLDRVGASGRYLLAGIEDLVNHAADLKRRLESI